jgi:Nucleotidyl transferase AbiEii toxin, Type IV TA system
LSDRSYDTPPKNLSSLEQRLRNIVEDGHLRLRTRRQIGYMAVIAALAAHAHDDSGRPLFAIKGGVAIELLMGIQARATKDLDAAFRAVPDEIEPRLRDALAQGWDGFTFRLTSWEPIHDTGAHRGDIKLAYQGPPFSTVQFEAAPAEGEAGQGCAWSTTRSSIPATWACRRLARCRS